MLHLYTAPTTNGQRGALIVVESGLPYTLHEVRMRDRGHKSPEYLAINPNGQVPTLIDDDGPDGQTVTLTQSVGMIWYVAEKCGRFIPADGRLRAEAMDWCLFGATDLYPPFAAMYFMEWAKPRDMGEAPTIFDQGMQRYAGRLNDHLMDRTWLVGDDYTVADISTYAMCALAWRDFPQLRGLTGIEAWMARMAARPTIAEAMGWFSGKGPQLDRSAAATH
jgi:GST-like protein